MAADAPSLNPEAFYRITYVSTCGCPIRTCGRQLPERGDPPRAAPRVCSVARLPLPALRGAHPAQRQHSPHLLSSAPRAVQELQGVHICALPCGGGNYWAPLRGGGLRV